TSPDLRHQLISNNIKSISNVFFTHFHADQTHGINDLRIFFLINKKQIPVFADKKTYKYLNSTFKYCFKSNSQYPSTLSLNPIKNKNIIINKKKKLTINAITVKHGDVDSICYIINKKLAYASDISSIYKKDLNSFKNLNFFVVDCLRFKFHPSHFNLEQVIKLIKIVKPKKTILTNMHSDLDYKKLKDILPKNIVPAYDGMTLTL
ncbi:MBL fold metallo-hydrolase, partial [Pelagibacterales bacterium SAG-MED20]|nr:MBL fold metallo-hydrolase [Pelagibacterales bacterium SAG-MED20]